MIVVPYDSGRAGYRMGAGPAALLDAGVQSSLESRGFSVTTDHLHVPDDAVDVLGHTIELADRVSAAVQSARTGGRFPVVLAGNCFISVGAVAGMGAGNRAVAWFDAHGDLNTPETSPSGFLDGMAAAVVLGWCHSTEAQRISGFVPLPGHRFMLVGARALDAAEWEAVDARRVQRLPADLVNSGRMSSVLDRALAGVSETYVPLDLDVLDAEKTGPANSFACAGGLTFPQILSVVEEIASRSSIAGLTVASYEPAADQTGIVRRGAVELIGDIARVAGQAGSGMMDPTEST